MEKLDKKFDKQTSELNEREQKFFKNLKDKWFNFYSMIKPFLIAIFMIWFFTRLKNLVGLEEATYFVLIVQLILLRHLLSKFS